jgi:hypothetical protein
MSKITNKRQVQKIRTTSDTTPSIGPSEFHQDKDADEVALWTPDDIYTGELILYPSQEKVYIGGYEMPLEILTTRHLESIGENVRRAKITLTGSELFLLANANEGYGVSISTANENEFVEVINTPIMYDNGIPFFDLAQDFVYNPEVYIYHGDGGQQYIYQSLYAFPEGSNIFNTANQKIKLFYPDSNLRMPEYTKGDTLYLYASIPSEAPIYPPTGQPVQPNPLAEITIELDYIIRTFPI